MASVADQFRRDTAALVARLSVQERIALALSLGDDDLALYVRTSGTERDTAVSELQARHARGRTPSRAAAPRR